MNKTNFKVSTFYLLLILLASFQIQAQENEGAKNVLGGSFSLSGTSNILAENPTSNAGIFNIEGIKSTIFQINPYVGKKINDKSMIGIGLNYGYEESRFTFFDSASEPDAKNSQHQLGIALFYRQYLLPDKAFNFFIQPNVAFNTTFGKEESRSPFLTESKGNNFGAAVDLHISYAFEKWNFIASLVGVEYQSSKTRMADQADSETTSSISFSSAFSALRIGVERKF